MAATHNMPAIPFNKPYLSGREFELVAQAIANLHSAAQGPFTSECEKLLAQKLGASAVLLTTSCTHALEMTGLILGVGPEDEVIVPAFTFVSTANAYALQGARLRFADIREETLNLDERQLPQLLTDRTRAVVAVHYGGLACEMDELETVLRNHPADLVEDNAHGLFGEYHGRPLGTFGRFATLSFHETKNFSCGEGGALVINRGEDLAPAEIIRDKGTNRRQFLRGEVDKYTWVSKGSSYAPSDLLAAFLLAQLQARKRIMERRDTLWDGYLGKLSPWAADRGVRLPVRKSDRRHTSHVFYLILSSEEERDSLMDHLRGLGILGVFHYQPLNASEFGRRYGGRRGDCPVSERMAARLLRLPLFNGMTEDEQDRVVRAVKLWRS